MAAFGIRIPGKSCLFSPKAPPLTIFEKSSQASRASKRTLLRSPDSTGRPKVEKSAEDLNFKTSRLQGLSQASYT